MEQIEILYVKRKWVPLWLWNLMSDVHMPSLIRQTMEVTKRESDDFSYMGTINLDRSSFKLRGR